MTLRNPIPPTQEFSVEWATLVAQNSYDVRLIDVDIDVTSVSANTTDEQVVTVSGIKSEDFIISVNKPTHTTGLSIGGYRVSADDTIAITFVNNTGSPIDPSSETYQILLLKNRI